LLPKQVDAHGEGRPIHAGNARRDVSLKRQQKRHAASDLHDAEVGVRGQQHPQLGVGHRGEVCVEPSAERAERGRRLTTGDGHARRNARDVVAIQLPPASLNTTELTTHGYADTQHAGCTTLSRH